MGKDKGATGQIGLIPIKALWCTPASLGSADLKQVCKCEDGSQYAIKETEKDATNPARDIWTAHNEYFCYRLGQIVGIASPNYHIVELSPGRFAFGSRWESGAQPQRWWDLISTGVIAREDILPTLARIYVFDLFVHNTDRHAGNLLIRQQHIGYAAIAFDYSRAWTFHGFPLPTLPFAASENTILVQKQLSSLLGSYVTEQIAVEVLDRISQITTDNIKEIIKSQPDSWLTKSVCQDIISWWSSPRKVARIDAIKTGIKNGTFL